MDDLDVLARNYGFRPQGKSNPMRSEAGDRRSASTRSSFTGIYDDDHGGLGGDNLFGGPPKYATFSGSNNNKHSSGTNDFDYDSIFNSSAAPPVYDKPVYDDDDIFDGLPGVKSSSTSTGFDFLENLTRKEPVPEVKSSSRSSGSQGFDDLLNGFGSGNPANSKRSVSESNRGPKSSSNGIDDPFVVLESHSSPISLTPGIFTDPLEEIGNLGKPGKTTKSDTSSAGGGGDFEFLDPLNGLGTTATPFLPEKRRMEKEKSPSPSGSRVSGTHTTGNREHVLGSFKQPESHLQRNAPDGIFDMPNVSANAQTSIHQSASSPPHVSANINETNSQPDMSPRSEELAQQDEDVWLTVSEIPLFTQPTSAPPPSRPPPPIPRRNSKLETSSFPSNARMKSNDVASPPGYSPFPQSPKGVPHSSKGAPVSQIDELEDFARGSSHNNIDAEMNASSAAAASAAAMKEAMDRAEAKFRYAREREYAKVARNRENSQVDKDEQATVDAQEREFRENQARLEQERHQREEEEREKRRLERERAREIENARVKQAVERATREARDRAAIEARLKAERTAQSEARERAERAAVQRAHAEARERLAAEAKAKAEKAAAETRERANKEAREREERDKEARAEALRQSERAAAAERATVEVRERAAKEARERAAKEAREKAAKEAREKAANAAPTNHPRDDDLESFFHTASRPNSAPKPRDSTPDTNTSNMRKASSTSNFFDDLSSLAGGAPVDGGFQEIPGESAERRKARWEREQRILERKKRVLDEKNARDLLLKKEQDDRVRISETVDPEIKRWAAGKEGNLRALLSTLQYVLWPGCGWQPVSLTDLINAASVKKVYKKATLCIHPDKVQQKGADATQKYVAEVVFDLLKEAYNKFNSEELF